MDEYGDLTTFGLSDMVRLARAVRDLNTGCRSVAEFAGRVCSHLNERLVDAEGTRQTLLVRFYGTAPSGALPSAEQDFVVANWGEQPVTTPCLVLLGTVGTMPDWNDRGRSKGHRVIPLTDARQLAGLPMVAALLHQLGIDVEALLSASAHLLHDDDAQQPYGVFHVPHAAGSPVIPAQDFVTEHGVKSVLGFGGSLPTGEVYAVVMFCRVEVPREAARLFDTVALSTSLAALDMLDAPLFGADDGPRSSTRMLSEVQRLRARESVLRALLEVHERVAVSEAGAAREALERATHEAARYSTLARTLQASLIPAMLPSLPGVETAAFYRPAGDGSEVGGDFYDVFPVRDGVWGLVLGDVSGKGAPAAALTALARYTVRAAAFHGESGVVVLSDLDEALHRHESDERYLTALFALLSPSPGRLVVDLTLGGHPAPLLVRANGDVEEVGEPGSVLGLLSGPAFSQTRHVLRPGDALVAFTDGMTEARRGNEQYGDGRLRAALRSCGGMTAAAIAARLGEDVLAFQGEHAHDDTAVVVLRCL
jgi:serine phosphatase RsbU (regulator of sigma subunit)